MKLSISGLILWLNMIPFFLIKTTGEHNYNIEPSKHTIQLFINGHNLLNFKFLVSKELGQMYTCISLSIQIINDSQNDTNDSTPKYKKRLARNLCLVTSQCKFLLSMVRWLLMRYTCTYWNRHKIVVPNLAVHN